MPKASKHAEVKPSKFKTMICQFFLRKEECPFGARCAFAHGDHELQSEERNVELLKATGLQRLDGAGLPILTATCNAMSAKSSLIPVLPTRASTHRKTVVVSLPIWTEAQEEEDVVELEDDANVAPLRTPPFNRERCTSRFSANCSREAPLMYRHNPYGLSTQYH